MLVHRVAQFAKKLLPPPLFKSVRAVTTGLFTPVAFSYQSGHFRSSLKSRAIDKSGKALPWYTYPAIDFLRQKLMTDRSVLEFGAGQSTLWWADRAKCVVSFESDEAWYRYVLKEVPDNVSLMLSDDAASEVQKRLNGAKFDLIIVDGLDRSVCAQMSIPLLNENGGVILDNSEGYWGPDGEHPIMDMFRDQGFSRIDFYGYAPGVILPSCTSLFFKHSCFLLAGSENPARLVS